MSSEEKTVYRVIQYGGRKGNIAVTDFESLVTHHPLANEHASLVNGVAADMEDQQPDYEGGDRDYAFIGGEFQEIQTPVGSHTFGLKNDQVLLKKDFILEHPDHPSRSNAARKVDVPSPITGYIGRIDASQGLVDIYDKKGGDVIVRVRHMRDISEAVAVGQTVQYGQTLGTQSDVKTEHKHVHLEMDTRYYQQYENYIADLVSGRLPVEAEHRKDIQPFPVIDDGVLRLGDSNERIRDLQRVMAREGYRAAGDRPLDQDGVYRLGMQGALLDFQRAHGVPQTGDIDPATMNFAPLTRTREVDRQDYFMPGRHIPLTPEPPTAPGHPDHPDHRPNLPSVLEPAINQHRNRQPSNHADRDADSRGPFNDPYLDRAYAAAISGNSAELDRIGLEFTQSQEGQRMLQWGEELYAQQQLEQQRQAQEQQMMQERHGPVMTR